RPGRGVSVEGEPPPRVQPTATKAPPATSAPPAPRSLPNTPHPQAPSTVHHGPQWPAEHADETRGPLVGTAHSSPTRPMGKHEPRSPAALDISERSAYRYL